MSEAPSAAGFGSRTRCHPTTFRFDTK